MTKNMTTPEVADICRASAETVRYWRHVGYGPPSFKVGRRVLYREVDVLDWLDGLRRHETTGSVA